MMFRDEAKYLREWVEFHLLIGIEHFYLYDHLSIDHPEVVLADYIAKGIVELHRRTEDVGENFVYLAVQMYNEGLDLARGECQWVAMLDSDEFIVPKSTTWLPTLLKDYERYGGLTVNWQMFGTGRVPEVPCDKTLIQSLKKKGLRNFGENFHVKSIVQPERVIRTVLHFAFYTEGFYAVNVNHKRIDGPYDPDVPVDKIQINHYFSRDLKFMNEVKIPRRVGVGTPASLVIAWDDEASVVEDNCILRYVEPLRARLGYPVKFDWLDYVNRYEDLKKAGIDTYEKAFRHWMELGRFEGRRYD